MFLLPADFLVCNALDNYTRLFGRLCQFAILGKLFVDKIVWLFVLVCDSRVLVDKSVGSNCLLSRHGVGGIGRSCVLFRVW